MKKVYVIIVGFVICGCASNSEVKKEEGKTPACVCVGLEEDRCACMIKDREPCTCLREVPGKKSEGQRLTREAIREQKY